MKLLTRQMFVNVVSAKEHKSIHSEWCVSRRCAYSRILLRRFRWVGGSICRRFSVSVINRQETAPRISFGDILVRMHHPILPKPLAKNAMLITITPPTSMKTSCHQINPLTGLSLLNYKKSVSRQLHSLTNLTLHRHAAFLSLQYAAY